MALFGAEITSLGLGKLEQRNNPLENPATPLSSPALWQWMVGGEPTPSGETVTEDNALQIITVYRCVTYIAEAIASLPLEEWQTVAGGRQKAIDEAVHYLLTVQPNTEMSAFDFKETLFGCEALTGNGYAQIERDGLGDPIALWPLHPHKTKPVRPSTGKFAGLLCYQTGDGMPLGQTRLVPAADVIHLKRFSLDGMLGISPVGVARDALGLAKATEKFGARFFGNGSRPAGVIFSKGPKPKDNGKEIVESWNREYGGTNQGKTAFLFGAEWDYKQVGLSPEDSQFLSTREYQRADIATLFGLSPHLVGDTARLSGANSEQENLRILTDTLRPYMSRAENEIGRKLLPAVPGRPSRFFVKFDPADRLTVDFKTQQEGFAAGVQWGWYSPNDVRRKLGENPGPVELDVYRVPVNMQSAETLLTTESIQDQPIGGAKPAPDAAAAGEIDQPTPAERKMLGVYTRSFVSVWRDAFGRVAHRSKRDAQTLDGIFRPVLRSLAGLAVEQCGIQDAAGAATFADGLVADVLKAIEKRAAKWPTSIPDVEQLAAAEFMRAVRSIHIATSREWAGIRAAREVSENA